MKKESLTYILICVLLSSIQFVSSCGTVANDDVNSINPNIIKLIDCCDRNDERYVSGDFYLGIKTDESLIATGPISIFLLDSDLNLVFTQEIWRDLIENFDDPFGIGFYFTINYLKQKILFVKSEFGDASVGSLYEYNLPADELSLIQDSSINISSAVYWHGDVSRLIYYSYGNDDGLKAGYYLYDKTTAQDSLLLAHRSEEGSLGPYDRLNGFDLSPDNRRLLIPNVRASFTGGPQAPQIIVYDLQTQQADTLDVEFDPSFVRIGLWLRYSPDGNRILYSQYPMNPFGGTANDDSEVGIIELPSRQKRVLDVNTNERNTRQSVQLAPTWSPDGRYIVYGSAPLFMPEGRTGYYSLYMLKNVDDSQNYK